MNTILEAVAHLSVSKDCISDSFDVELQGQFCIRSPFH